MDLPIAAYSVIVAGSLVLLALGLSKVTKAVFKIPRVSGTAEEWANLLQGVRGAGFVGLAVAGLIVRDEPPRIVGIAALVSLVLAVLPTAINRIRR